MQFTRTIVAGLATAALAMAQDRVTLSNGDVLTGRVKTMADGYVTIASPVLGDVKVKLIEIDNMVTEAEIELRTVNGETFKRRVAGIENDNFRLEGDIPALAVKSVEAINPPPKAPPQWTGSVSLNGLWIDGNTRRRTVGLVGEAQRESEIDRFLLDVYWDYAEDNPQAPTNNGVPQAEWDLQQRRVGGGLKYDYFLGDRWYALATTRVLGDTFADIELRYTAGLGVGYTVVDTKTTSLTTEAGLSYFNESYRSATPTQDYLAARIAYRLRRQVSDRTAFKHSVEAFPSLEDSDDIYLQLRAELINNLTDNMIATLSWVMDYDNTPSPGFKRADHRVMLSVGWAF